MTALHPRRPRLSLAAIPGQFLIDWPWCGELVILSDQTRAAKPVSTEIEPGLPANGQVFTVPDA